MILTLLLVLQAPAEIARWDGLPFPDPVGRPAARYITCLSEPLEQTLTSVAPEDPAARQARLDRVLADCRSTREEVAAEMNAKLAHTPGWTDSATRRLKVERMLSATEERVGFTVVDREDFLKMANEALQCATSGEKDCQPK